MGIVIQNLYKSYSTNGKPRVVFEDFSCELQSRDRVALLGKNGSGKSTLIRILSGAELPDRGKVSTSDAVSWPVGLSSGFASGMSAKHNCEFVLRLYGLSGLALKERLSWVENFSEIGSYFDEPVKGFSSGMRSRVAFALSMALDFDWYLIDEITAVGDQDFRRKCATTLKEKRESSGLIFVSHNLYEVAQWCNKAIVFEPTGAKFYSNVSEGLEAYKKC